MVGGMVQVMLPAELQDDSIAHGFCKWGTTTMFDIQISKLDMVSYLHMMPEKALGKVEKDNKDKYLQACLERRHALNPMFYSDRVIPGTEDLSVQMILASYLSFQLKRKYSKMCGFL